jgi:hypothetical protein
LLEAINPNSEAPHHAERDGYFSESLQIPVTATGTAMPAKRMPQIAAEPALKREHQL